MCVNVLHSQKPVKIRTDPKLTHLTLQHPLLARRKDQLRNSERLNRLQCARHVGIERGKRAVFQIIRYPLHSKIGIGIFFKIKADLLIIIDYGKAKARAILLHRRQRRHIVMSQQSVRALNTSLHVIKKRAVEIPQEVRIILHFDLPFQSAVKVLFSSNVKDFHAPQPLPLLPECVG